MSKADILHKDPRTRDALVFNIAKRTGVMATWIKEQAGTLGNDKTQ